jgi:hypothetical protein
MAKSEQLKAKDIPTLNELLRQTQLPPIKIAVQERGQARLPDLETLGVARSLSR